MTLTFLLHFFEHKICLKRIQAICEGSAMKVSCYAALEQLITFMLFYELVMFLK